MKALELVVYEKEPGRYGREPRYNSPDGFWAYPESHVDGYAMGKRLTDAELAAEYHAQDAKCRHEQWIETVRGDDDYEAWERAAQSRMCEQLTAHLEVVTNRENVLRGIGPSARNAAKDHCRNGHQFDSIGNKGERQCSKCTNERTRDWSRAQRKAIVCGAKTRDGGPCKMRISQGNACRNHPVSNPLPATVLHEPEPQP